MPTELSRLASRVARLRPTAVNAILAEVRACTAAGKDVVSLMRGQPDFATPAPIVEAAERALRAGRTVYPDNRGEPRLRDAVARKLARDGLSYDAASEILITTGASEGIAAAMLALLEPGDEVLLPDPVYDAYQSPVRLAGAEPRPVASRVVGGRFTIAAEDLEAAWTPACRLLLLNSPWNPVGTVFTRDELSVIGEFAQRRDLILISDEIYEAIVYDGARHLSPASLSPELRDRTILLNSLSKTYAMTGWRVGYCAAPAAFIQAMFLVLQQWSRGAATFVQDASSAALDGPQDAVEEMRAEYANRRARVLGALEGIPGVRPLAPDGGFFAMADIRGLELSSNEVRRLLLWEDGVVVVHGAAYGPAAEGLLRVSFGSGGRTLEEGLERLRRGLERIAGGAR